MAFFAVTMTHPDGEGWGLHAPAHETYLRELAAAGTLRPARCSMGRSARAS